MEEWGDEFGVEVVRGLLLTGEELGEGDLEGVEVGYGWTVESGERSQERG